MKSHQVTIKDIARTLGISPSTVSRALKDHPDISPETKQLVQEFAQKVNYRPNALALGLRKSKTNTIGVVIPEIVHHFFSSVISGIEDVAYGKGYNVMICQTNESCQREVAGVQELVDNRVDGILISMSKSTTEFSHFEDILDNGIPLIFFDRVCQAIDSHRIIADDYQGGRIATKHLIDRGCRRILHLAGPEHLLIAQNRKNGYMTALRENNIAVDENLIFKCDTREDVFSFSDRILNLAPDIDGVFTVNDSTAIGVMQILQRNGYRVPADIAVIGFGDGPNASITCPTLSTVEQKGYEIGQEAMRMLARQIESGLVEVEFETRIFTPVLHPRESTQK